MFDPVLLAVALIFFSAGLGMIVNKHLFLAIMESDLEKNPLFIVFGGLISILVGVGMLSYGQSMTDWIDTLFVVLGFMGIIKGVLLFVHPKSLFGMGKKFLNNTTLGVAGWAYFIVGLILLYMTFAVS